MVNKKEKLKNKETKGGKIKIMKEKRKFEKGITLIALVITIIILLLLVAVSIATLAGENGILAQAQKAEKNYDIASEREYLELNVVSVQLGKYMENVSSKKLGKDLNARDLDHSYNWHIIKVNDKNYETGWNYVEKGTELQNYGKAEHSWLVNYETGEIIQLEENNYISLSAGDMLAVKDNLIINVDSSIIDENVKNNKASLENQLGKGVELINFDYNNNSGLTSTSFNFDGVNDYIKVQYDKPEQKKQLAQRGFTFEFYGIWNGGTTAEGDTQGYKGIFCYWNGNEKEQARFRFGISETRNELFWNAGWKGGVNALSDFSSNEVAGGGDAWNQRYKLDLDKLRKEIYITITVDTSTLYSIENKFGGKGNFYKQTVYLDGNVLYEGNYNKIQWDDFVNSDLNNLKYFCIGRSSQSGAGLWHYSKMNAYCLRLYSKALSEDEVHKNYEKSVEYHSLLEQ